MKALTMLLLAGAIGLDAQAPTVSNARFANRAVAGEGEKYLRDLVSSEAGPAWFGYAVESNRKGTDGSCCWDGGATGCHLEGGRGRIATGQNTAPVKLEGATALAVLFRVEKRVAGKVHPVSENCPLDAGGLPFVWLTGVSPRASVRFLSGLVQDEKSDSALLAIAMHSDSLADEVLEGFAAPARPEWLREKALFWMANSRGAAGFAAVKRAAEHDPSESIREKAMFDFTLTREPGAVNELIHYAKQDSSPKVRGQALFWLAQKAGQKASAAIHDAVVNDPEIEVKKKAVFALQQLPKDEGVPLLIEAARTNANPEVRKQAIFWLGQSGDPRALAFFQDVLNGKL